MKGEPTTHSTRSNSRVRNFADTTSRANLSPIDKEGYRLGCYRENVCKKYNTCRECLDHGVELEAKIQQQTTKQQLEE